MKPTPLFGLALVGALAVGCATTKTAKKDQTEYVYVNVVGSNLPIKVPKDRMQTARSSTDVAVVDPEALRGIQSRSPIKNPPTNGQ